jgi:hypothetical protein
MLSSMLLRQDTRLQACAVNHAMHITRGARGVHVGRIQLALLLLGFAAIAADEWQQGQYGQSTAAAVLAYKRSRHIVNRTYQQQADDIVGVMTILELDKELGALLGCLPAVAPPPQSNGVRDSAVHFELRRCLSLLRQTASQVEPFSDAIFAGRGVRTKGGERIDAADVARVVTAISDLAADFQSLLQSTVDTKMVGPRPGGDRARICQSNGLSKPGDTFEQAKSCWEVLEVPKPVPKPIVIHWCGIYAADIWRRNAFPAVSWYIGDKRPGICIDKHAIRPSSNLKMLAPGDVLIDLRPLLDGEGKPKLDPNTNKEIHAYHHMLVLEVAVDRTETLILQGNSGGQPPGSSVVSTAKLDLRQINRSTHCFKSVDTLSNAAQVYV